MSGIPRRRWHTTRFRYLHLCQTSFDRYEPGTGEGNKVHLPHQRRESTPSKQRHGERLECL
jgi:hypothetical protein